MPCGVAGHRNATRAHVHHVGGGSRVKAALLLSNVTCIRRAYAAYSISLQTITKSGQEPINGAQSSTLGGANNECAAGCLDHILCDDMQFVNKQDPLNLHKQSV